MIWHIWVDRLFLMYTFKQTQTNFWEVPGYYYEIMCSVISFYNYDQVHRFQKQKNYTMLVLKRSTPTQILLLIFTYKIRMLFNHSMDEKLNKNMFRWKPNDST